jgi:hypothetical protein
MIVARTKGYYTYAANVWALSIVQGPFSVVNVTIRNFFFLFIAVRILHRAIHS